MSYTTYFICIALAQFSSAQVVSYVQRNSIPQQIVTNVQSAVTNAKAVPSNAVTVARAVPVASNAVNNANAVSSANLASANLANANIANANIANINAANGAANHNIAIGNYAGTGYANAANYANAVNLANTAYTSPASAYTSNSGIIPAQVANVNPVNNVASANAAAIASELLPTINGNIATFNLGTNGNTFTVTSGSPGAQGFGISVMADALEVGGTVAVNGQIPIFGTVAVNGNVPTDGSAAVNYNCGGKQVVSLEP